MNTSKQVNVMIGLMMVLVIAGVLYALWDDSRAEHRAEEQLLEDTERGGALYALNCRACHGLTGQGSIERVGLPGPALNLEANRPESFADMQALQHRFRETIRCGRVGTLMPPWAVEEGGALNFYQIEQLVLLITGEAAEHGWEAAIEEAAHADEFEPHKLLTAAVSEEDTVLPVTDVLGVNEEMLLRIDDEPHGEEYEIVLVVAVNAENNEIEVERGAETPAREFAAGAELFREEEIPPLEPLVGEIGDPPCGQVFREPAPPAVDPTEVTGEVDVPMGDNFFEYEGVRNPLFQVQVGDEITMNLPNEGLAPHNMRVTGDDGEYGTDDDFVSDPELIAPGEEGQITFVFTETGTFDYHCDFHPTDMLGQIEVVE